MNKSLSRKILTAYALPAFPLAALLLPVYIFLPTHYAVNMGLGLATVGFIRLIAGLWDVVTDPVIGVLSDRTPAHIIGAPRKIWIGMGLPLCMLGAWFLLNPAIGVTSFYMAAWSLVMVLGWTMMLLPLNALGAELSNDYHERNRINAWREAFGILGVLVPLGLVAIFAKGAGQEGQALHVISLLVLVTLPVATIICCQFVPQPQAKRTQNNLRWQDAVTALKTNKPFMRLILSYFINAVANGLPASLMLLYVGSVLEDEERIGIYLFTYFLAGLVAIPFWTWAAKRYSKHRVWSCAMIFACLVFMAVPFLGAGDTLPYLLVCIFTGLAFGADLALPPSMQADVIDIDRAQTKTERAGLFFALWGIATKLSLAIATALSFMILDWTAQNSFVLISLYAIIPIIFKLAAVGTMWNHPLNAQKLKTIQQQ
jgi:glycoside/pentoside/hexuronide:cation symporter, GPH family